MSLAERRRCVTYLRNEYELSERRACQVMQMHRSSYRYVGQQELVDAAYREVVRLSQRFPYFGYRKIYELMRDSWTISRERVRLIRRREGLQVVKKRRKRKLLGMTTQWVHRAEYPNHGGATTSFMTRRTMAASSSASPSSTSLPARDWRSGSGEA